MSKNKRKIINCYYKDSRSGIGDFIRGSIFLYEFCEKNHIDFDIDFSHHPILKYLNIDAPYDYSADDINCMTSISESRLNQSDCDFYHIMEKEINKILKTKKENNYIFCNFSEVLMVDSLNVMPSINNKKLSSRCFEWFNSKIKLNYTINSDVEKYLKSINLSAKQFNIVHLRVGDDASFFKSSKKINHFDKDWFPDKKSCFSLCLRIYQSLQKKPLLILSDNNEIKEYIKQESIYQNLRIYIPHIKSAHTQKNPSFVKNKSIEVQDDSFYYTCFDARLIELSSSVRSFSVYFWGSGFSSWFCKIFGVPFFSRQFVKLIDMR